MGERWGVVLRRRACGGCCVDEGQRIWEKQEAEKECMVEAWRMVSSGHWLENGSKVEKVQHPWSTPGIWGRLEPGGPCFSSQNCKDGSCSKGRSWTAQICLWHHLRSSIPYSPTPGNPVWILWRAWHCPHYIASVFAQLYQSSPDHAPLGACRRYPSPFWSTQSSEGDTHGPRSALPCGHRRPPGRRRGLG